MSTLPVLTLKELKAALPLDNAVNEFDDLLKDCIAEATQGVSEYIRRPLLTTKNINKKFSGDGESTLLLVPYLQSVESITINGTAYDLTLVVVDNDTGELTMTSGTFTSGTKNILISFTNGWPVDQLPATIKGGVKMYARHLYNAHRKDRIGVSSVSVGDQSITYEKGIPQDVKELVGPHRIAV